MGYMWTGIKAPIVVKLLAWFLQFAVMMQLGKHLPGRGWQHEDCIIAVSALVGVGGAAMVPIVKSKKNTCFGLVSKSNTKRSHYMIKN